MLARIINERGLADTALGTLSLTAGAFDDAVSWCVLAIVLATFGGGPGVALIAIVGGLGFALFMFFIARRLLLRSEEHTSELQSLMRISYAVFCLKKKTISINIELKRRHH